MSFNLQQNYILSPIFLLNCQALLYIDCMIASSSITGRSSIFYWHFRSTRMLMASEMIDEEMTSLGSLSAPNFVTYSGVFFYFLEGKPIAVWSGADSQSFRSGAGCRIRQTSIQNNTRNIFLNMLVTSSPVISLLVRKITKRELRSVL